MPSAWLCWGWGADRLRGGPALAEETLRVLGRKGSARALLQGCPGENGASLETAGLEEEIWQAYCARLEERGMLDFDDLLIRALALDTGGRTCFRHLLVDEFQDINETQYRLVGPGAPAVALCHRRPGPVHLRFPGADGRFPAPAAERLSCGDPAGGELPLHAGGAGGCRPRDREKSGRLPPAPTGPPARRYGW